MKNYQRERIIKICDLDKTECKHRGKCETCEKAPKEPPVNERSADFKAGYQQALDDIRWGRCKHKNFEYHARARSQKDRIAEIRAIDKETLKGGGNIPQE